ncbi:unnamed protein product [Ambrosiozyma monospora]|uniref:Unnamed protein product n=1 Tax=Ambrosiozyma monospora TaxID=43982 RepID=A0ACB5TZT3_AMBMO|nr:unnamed protein product [Ambrosiozyma monospora]
MFENKYQDFLKKLKLNPGLLDIENLDLGTGIKIDFVMKIKGPEDGTPVLLVEMAKASIEHLFDEDNLSTYQTQSNLSQCYIYDWIYQMPVMISDGYHHFMVWFKKPGEIRKHPGYAFDTWNLFYPDESNDATAVADMSIPPHITTSPKQNLEWLS